MAFKDLVLDILEYINRIDALEAENKALKILLSNHKIAIGEIMDDRMAQIVEQAEMAETNAVVGEDRKPVDKIAILSFNLAEKDKWLQMKSNL